MTPDKYYTQNDPDLHQCFVEKTRDGLYEVFCDYSTCHFYDSDFTTSEEAYRIGEDHEREERES